MITRGTEGPGPETKQNLRATDSQPLQERPDLRAGPVRIADNLAPDNAFAVDDVGLGPSIRAIELGYLLVWVPNGLEVDVKAIEESLVCAGILIDAHGQNGKFRVVVVESDERRSFLNARTAPAGPEIEQNHLAAIVGKLNGIGPV